MAASLCLVCQSIPPQAWSYSYDLKEDSREMCIKLQTLGDMEAAKDKGCQLCTVLLNAPDSSRQKEISGYRLQGKREMMYLRRSLASPDRAIELGVGPRGTQSISRTFFYRMPSEWCRPEDGPQGSFIRTPYVPRFQSVSLNSLIDNVELMANWLRVCQEQHPECSKYRPSFLPTRLLDVRAFERNEDIRLVTSQLLTSDTYCAKTYLTLSHCWGKTDLITTTTWNLGSRLNRIAFDDLSRTFRDAVTLTRQLGQRYIWIDSLCIVQDDEEDWAREAARMAKVYGNSYCTLAALSSADGTGGCSCKADVQKSMSNAFFDLRTSGASEPYVRVFCKEPVDWTTDYDGPLSQSGESQSPLRYRAWVLQERELSRRSIHFAKNQLLWECKQMKGSTQLPWLEMKKAKGLVYPEGWLQLTEDYSLRGLTKSADKLPALSGVAEKYQDKKGQYLAGLWSDDFPAALMWQSTDPYARRHSTYRAPSWSWASLQGRVSYDTQRLVPPHIDYPNPRDNPPRMLDSIYRGVKLAKAAIQPVHSNYIYGTIREGACIILKNACLFQIDMPARTVQSKEQLPNKKSEHLLRNGGQIGVLFRDTAADLVDAQAAFMLALQHEPICPLTEHSFQLHQAKNMIDTVMGIVVIKDKKHKDSFKRLGLARWVDERLLAGCRPRDVTLF